MEENKTIKCEFTVKTNRQGSIVREIVDIIPPDDPNDLEELLNEEWDCWMRENIDGGWNIIEE